MVAWFFVWGPPEFVIGFLVASAVISVIAWGLRRIDENRTAVLATKPPKPCRRCGNEVSLVVTHCPHCGIREPTATELSPKTWLLIIAAIFSLPLLVHMVSTVKGVPATIVFWLTISLLVGWGLVWAIKQRRPGYKCPACLGSIPGDTTKCCHCGREFSVTMSDLTEERKRAMDAKAREAFLRKKEAHPWLYGEFTWQKLAACIMGIYFVLMVVAWIWNWIIGPPTP
jgi:hypothetical protein